MQGTQRAIFAIKEGMTLEHLRQESGELAETEKMIFVTGETMQEEVKEARPRWTRTTGGGLGEWGWEACYLRADS
jgi:hypothetical protein